MKPRSPNVYYAMMAAKERFRHSSSWFPFPCLIAFFLVLLLTSHVVMSVSPRVGHIATVLPLSADETEDSVIWISVIIENGDVVVADNYRKVFRWPESVKSISGLEPFINHLKDRSAAEVKSAALSTKIHSGQKKVVIAIDQSLKFWHFRPILYALAEAGISNYGFETIDLLQEEKPTDSARNNSDPNQGPNINAVF